NYMPAALDEIARDRASHDTQSDDANNFIHTVPFPPLNLIDGQGWPRLIGDRAINNRQVTSVGQAGITLPKQVPSNRPGGDHRERQWRVLVEGQAQVRPRD